MSNFALELSHHGILGQKWGKKNGPPYPLDYDKLSEKERRQAIDKSIRDGDVITTNRNRKYYTDDEVNQVIKRFEINTKLSQLNASQIKTGLDKIENLCDTMGKISDYGEKAVKGWNTVAKISNSLTGTELPLITNDGKSKPKSDNNNQNKNNGGNNNHKINITGNKSKYVKINYDGAGTMTNKNVKVTRGKKTVEKNYKYVDGKQKENQKSNKK